MRPQRSASAARRRQPGDAAREHDVGLQHVDAAAQDEVSRLVRAAHHLARRDADAGQPAECAVALDVVAAQRLLEPVGAQALQLARTARRRRDVPAPLAVTRHAPALIGVDHQLEVVADRGADVLDDGHVLAPVGVVEAQLECAHAALAQRDRPPCPLVRVDQLAARGVGQQALVAAAQKPPHGRVEQPPGEIPDRALGRPRPAAVEVDGLADLAHRLGAQRIEPDQEALEDLAVGQVIAARAARDADVGVHEHERRVLVRARKRVPGGLERRLQRVAVAARLDAGDACLGCHQALTVAIGCVEWARQRRRPREG